MKLFNNKNLYQVIDLLYYTINLHTNKMVTDKIYNPWNLLNLLMKKLENNNSTNSQKLSRTVITILILVAILIIVLLANLGLGSVRISVSDIINALFNPNSTGKAAIIIKSIRLPRVIAGFLAGIALSTSGIVLQGVMNNALAGPGTIGVNSGAGFAVMLAYLMFPKTTWAGPLFSFFGALITTIVIFMLAYFGDRSRMTIILAGITVSSFLSAGINLIKTLDNDITINLNSFMMGSLAGVSYSSIALPAIGIIVAFVLALIMSKALNIINLGDDIARSLGVRVNLLRFLLLIISSVLAGCVVSFAGLLGFVGLIVPHISRKLFGNDARILIPCSALIGASMVLLCDMIGRVVFSPYELPAGILMSFIGGPFFLYLLLRKKGGRRINA